MNNKRYYIKGLENGKLCWNNISDINIDDLERAPILYNLSPITWIEEVL